MNLVCCSMLYYILFTFYFNVILSSFGFHFLFIFAFELYIIFSSFFSSSVRHRLLNNRTVSGSTSCTNSVFGDPLYGTVKECQCITTAVAASASVKCANEGGVCACVGEVMYGKGVKYVRKAAIGSISCTNGVFGDPLVGTFKECLCNSSPLLGSLTSTVFGGKWYISWLNRSMKQTFFLNMCIACAFWRNKFDIQKTFFFSNHIKQK